LRVFPNTEKSIPEKVCPGLAKNILERGAKMGKDLPGKVCSNVGKVCSNVAKVPESVRWKVVKNVQEGVR